MGNRKSGILLHITSLPGNEGTGTMGGNAYRFVDFLNETGQKVWQILPLGQVGFGDSPYQCYSAFAGNSQLIDLKLLENESLIDSQDLKNIPSFSNKIVEFERVGKWKNKLFQSAFKQFKNLFTQKYEAEYNVFLSQHSWWLNDYAFFMAAKNNFWLDISINERNCDLVE